MSKQISVLIDDDLTQKIAKIQNNFKKEYGKSLSFSKVLNEILRKEI